MKTITKIEANRSAAVHRKCRVAAYCRVSTEHDDQIESLETQKAHYESWIKLHTEWESAGIFYDAGITGTKAEIRPGLQDLLQACRMGRVDRILVKSISRFSRNTAECLALVRELSGIGVSVFFEKENIDTGSMESELFLTILSSMAEEESLSISRNEKWSVQHRFQNGTYVSSSFPYGYCRNDRGELVLEPEEAEIVKYIFSALLSGKSSCQIAGLLEQQGIPFKNGRHWCDATIRGIVAMKNMWEMFCCRKRIPMYIFIGTKIMGKWNVIFFQIITYQLLVGKLLQKQMQSFDSELPKKALCVVQESIKSDMLFPER